MNQYVELARPGRAFANLCATQTLPAGTDSINVPKVLAGNAVGVQTGDNTPVRETDLADTFISAPVRTIAGQQSVAIQLIDQSPIAFDDVIFRDLTAAHATELDKQCLYGSGTTGQVLAVLGTPNIQSIPVSSLDVPGIVKTLANVINLVNTTRFLPPHCIVMDPRRWSWLLTLLDTQERPLFVPTANAPSNALGILSNVAAEQVVGQVHGLPVVTDPNLPTNRGAGSNENVMLVLRSGDLLQWESGVRAQVLPETKAGALTVLLQIFSYVAFSAGRQPQGIVEITGFTPPTW